MSEEDNDGGPAWGLHNAITYALLAKEFTAGMAESARADLRLITALLKAAHYHLRGGAGGQAEVVAPCGHSDRVGSPMCRRCTLNLLGAVKSRDAWLAARAREEKPS